VPDRSRRTVLLAIFAAFVSLATVPQPAAAAERLCDPALENCRTQLLSLINNERVGIDVGFWFMEDNRYVTAIVKRWQAGVPVRILVDPRANPSYPYNATILNNLAAAGIPMRKRLTSNILHWKMMLFAGQRVVEFSGANFSDDAFVPVTPYANYVDESIFYSDDDSIVESFMTKFDDAWVSTSSFGNYANISGTLARRYPTFPIDPELQFGPATSYTDRALALYAQEPVAIDVVMYRITQQKHSDAMIAARNRGVQVRIISEQNEYRNPARPWVAWNIDRMWKAGVTIRMRGHAGLNHQKSVILHGLRTVIFGSSNWTGPSDKAQYEHNYFSRSKPWIYTWFTNQFTRKWTNVNPSGSPETKTFSPLPPSTPKVRFPANLATGVTRTVTLKWYGGPWAHYYDIYFGTTNPPPLVASNRNLGPSDSSTDYQRFSVSSLAANRTYYWKIVSRTAAGKTATGSVWSFVTGN
jgi:phosphatidylserine/phosphatidylglycerophosphate/cardiolipin synthase-like enzyme